MASAKDIIAAFRAARRLTKVHRTKAAPEPTKNPVSEFDNADDWIMSVMLVAIMHANPGISTGDAMKKGMDLAKRIYAPNSQHLWKRQIDRMERLGVRAIASRIRRELYKLL